METNKKLSGFFKQIFRSSIYKLEDPLIRGKLKTQVHCLENKTAGIIFLKDAIAAFSCSKPLKESFISYLEGTPRSQACQMHGTNEIELDYLLKILLDKIDFEPRIPKKSSHKNVLDRLVLNISNSCNLRCSYCYAGGGNYGGDSALMSRNTALATIDWFSRRFDGINQVQFFGGEPLLNPDLISFICNAFLQRKKTGGINKSPQFSIVTNGTIQSDEIFKLLKKYEIKTTVSMDGPKAINDHLRGNGTTHLIEKFIKGLESFNLDYGFEATYTAHHQNSGISLNGLLDFFFRRFGQSEVHIPPASLSKENPLFMKEQELAPIYRRGVEYSLERLKNGESASLSFASRIMDVFVKGSPIRNYCPAGFFTLSVDPKGYVYPCFMFTGKKDFQLGNIFNENSFQHSTTKQILQSILMNDKANHPQCQKCWAAPFCSGCIGADYIAGQDLSIKKGCDITKAMVEGFLAKTPDFINPLPKAGFCSE